MSRTLLKLDPPGNENGTKKRGKIGCEILKYHRFFALRLKISDWYVIIFCVYIYVNDAFCGIRLYIITSRF